MTGRLGWSESVRLARRGTPNDRLRFWASATSAAVAAALTCLAVSLATLGRDRVQSVVQVVAEGGTRGGAAFAVALVAVAALYLTGRTWQLGSVERRERLQQLRDAGATPRDLRRVAIADAALPVGVGATLGVTALGIVVAAVGSLPVYASELSEGPGGTVVVVQGERIVGMQPLAPNPVVQTPWAAVLGVVIVTVVAAYMAARASHTAAQPAPPRRGPVALTAGLLAGRARSPALVIALRRIAADPRTTTRPAALLFLVAVAASAATWLEVEFRVVSGESSWERSSSYFSQAFGLVRWWTVAGLLLCATGLALSLADSVLRRRRADAAALAAGVPMRVLRAALVLQTLLPALPAIAVGAVLGAVVPMYLTGTTVHQGGGIGAPLVDVPIPWGAWFLWIMGILAVTLGSTLVATRLLHRTTRMNQLRIPA